YKSGHRADIAEWWRQLNDIRERYPLGWDEPPDGTLSPQYAIKRLGEIAGPDAIYVAGVGQHQMWASQFISYEKPGTWLNSGGAGAVGDAGVRRAGRHGREGRPARRRRVGDRRRRMLPDDQPGAGHLRARGHPDQ